MSKPINPNPLLILAAEDRHTECCQNDYCRTCGSRVSTYNANQSVITLRPEAEDEDWWSACDNDDCVNAYGAGVFQRSLAWVETKEVEKVTGQ